MDFDASKFAPGAPCEDCQYDMPGDWTRGWPRIGRTPEVKAERERLIREKWMLYRLDPEIAEELGISSQTVLRYRKDMGLPAITREQRPDMDMWKDQEAHRKHAANMVSLRKSVGRGSIGRYHIKGRHD